ncbi:1,2-phenylacetyl-CoA epoxidase subunit B [Aneurinibacillus uraniidurans]|uniref:1,2-phenylacetyl-CoA epoxidase subunit B n=1 Tax=Aneurinibacillus uraniidurans TaxID=2966586 RepID=UPI0023492115|nr:1,2-phenylacetyl-CoA epoxidase subunit B [Aneurinibacillus sp. B1]WCN38426.1 1,2-phenylacetyl-CoA epoxidase subunit B [Aneurinibacillus sp. B1]
MSTLDAKDYDVYEVFSQKELTAKFESQFSLLAPTPEIALSMAQDNFMRREEVPANIFVVKRDHMHFVSPEERQAFERIDNKDYRQPAHYGYIPSRWRELAAKNNTSISVE